MPHCFSSNIASVFFVFCPFESYKWQLLCFELSSVSGSLTVKRTNGVPWYDKHFNQLFLNGSSDAIQTVRVLIYTYTTVLVAAPCGSHWTAVVIRLTSAWFHRCLGGLHTLQVCQLVTHPGNYLYTVSLMTGGEGEPQEGPEKGVRKMWLHLKLSDCFMIVTVKLIGFFFVCLCTVISNKAVYFKSCRFQE